MLVNVITINEVTSLIIEGRNLMSHVQTFHELYERVAKQIITSGEEWKKFLGFSSQLYKYSFPEKLMIYGQNPEVEYLADFQTWNELGRFIKKEYTGVILF